MYMSEGDSYLSSDEWLASQRPLLLPLNLCLSDFWVQLQLSEGVCVCVFDLSALSSPITTLALWEVYGSPGYWMQPQSSAISRTFQGGLEGGGRMQRVLESLFSLMEQTISVYGNMQRLFYLSKLNGIKYLEKHSYPKYYII